MDWLIQAGRAFCAKRGRRQHADGTGQHGGFIGQDVSEQIVCQDHIKLFRCTDKLHGARICIHVGKIHTGAQLSMRERHFLTPEQTGIHDVGFFDRANAARAATSNLEGNARHAFDFRVRINGGVISAAQPTLLINAARCAEINASGQLTDDHDVQTFNHFRLQAGFADQRWEAESRAKIGKHIETLAQCQQARLGAFVARRAYPFRAANSAQQNSVRTQRALQGLIRQRRAMRIIGGAADKPFFNLQIRRQQIHQPLHLGNNFRANSVTGQQQKGLFHVLHSTEFGPAPPTGTAICGF